MKYTIVFLLLLLLCSSMSAQHIPLTGIVQAETTGLPLPYTNIGIRNKNIGTASDDKGQFTLKLDQQHLQDTLTISAIGYQELAIPVATLATMHPLKLQLKEKVTALQEVVVSSRKMQLKKLGVTGRVPGVWGVPEKQEERDIYEFANFIQLKGKPAEVLSAHFYLSSSMLDSALFRINFYHNQDGLPGKRLVEKSIIGKLSTKDGWVSIDLSKHDIYLSEDFFLGVEYLPAEGDNRLDVALGGKITGTAFSRKSSLGEWNKIKGVSLSSYVTARQ
jgi:hypothetical protein